MQCFIIFEILISIFHVKIILFAIIDKVVIPKYYNTLQYYCTPGTLVASVLCFDSLLPFFLPIMSLFWSTRLWQFRYNWVIWISQNKVIVFNNFLTYALESILPFLSDSLFSLSPLKTYFFEAFCYFFSLFFLQILFYSSFCFFTFQ